ARLRGGPLEQGVQEGMLRSSYHNALRESAAAFAVVNTAHTAVDFLGLHFARRWLDAGTPAIALALLAAAGAVVWVASRHAGGGAGLDAIAAAAVAFGLTAVAGLARLYPYGPTRHDSFLLLFLLPLAGLAVSAAVQRRVALAFALILAWGVYQGAS